MRVKLLQLLRIGGVDLGRHHDHRLSVSERPWPKLASSLLITLKSSTGSGRPEASDTSTRWTSTRVRSMWRRNWTPRPEPRCAPSIKPGHVGYHERLLVRLLAHRDHTQIRLQRGERIIGDLRPGGRDARDQRRLAGVRISDQADIGEQFQFQPVRFAPRRGGPTSCSRGAWWVLVAKCWLPRPPRPPLAMTRRSSGSEKSCTSSPVSSS